MGGRACALRCHAEEGVSERRDPGITMVRSSFDSLALAQDDMGGFGVRGRQDWDTENFSLVFLAEMV